MEGTKTFDSDSRSFAVESSREEAYLEKLSFFAADPLFHHGPSLSPSLDISQYQSCLERSNNDALACIFSKELCNNLFGIRSPDAAG